MQHFSEKEILVMTSGGVGYSVIPAGSLLASVKQGEVIEAEVLMIVRENDISLYGFGGKEEKILFQKLIGISGVGPKMGLAMVSVPVDAFLKAVEEGDVAFLTQIPGLGKKKAERLIVELRGKIDLSAIDAASGPKNPDYEEAVEAIEGLGYAPDQIRKVLDPVKDEGMNSEGLVRYFLSRG